MSFVSVRQERRWRRHPDGTAFAISALVHALLLGLFFLSLFGPAPPPKPTGANLSVFKIGTAPAAGTQKADKPARPAKQKQKRAKPSKRPKAEMPSQSDRQDQSDKPTIAIGEANIAPPPAAAQQQDQNGEDEVHADQQLAFDDNVDLAFGINASGTATGDDPGLRAAISVAIAAQIRACWTPPTNITAPTLNSAERRIISATFSEDGALAAIPTVYLVAPDQQSRPDTPTSAESAAINALERCSPIKLPGPLYSYWKEVQIELAPKAPDPDL